VSEVLTDRLVINTEIAAALAAGGPVVALESTIITHGMPFPTNLETAVGVEAIIRKAGAAPATIALLDGRIHIGLDAAQLRRLATTGDVVKVSRRDLAATLLAGAAGSTTVAATMICAALAGIKTFATGGIGGVHRGVAESFDISADLQELSRTRVAVICAGAKAILDLTKTLEYLETLGVPVVTIGAKQFPAFFCADSGLASPLVCDDAAQAAGLAGLHWGLGLSSGLLFATPVPAGDGIAKPQSDAWIGEALAQADAASIAGKEVTPYLLARLNELSAGQTLAANIALIKNNARVAAEFAIALAVAGET
jgi:pseudouridine-5'-phosphate glycosidase